MKRVFFIVICFFLFVGVGSAALGVVPARSEYAYVPGKEIVIPFQAITDDPEQQVLLFVETDNDFNNSVVIDKRELIGGGSFTVTIRMPASVRVPGKHRIGIVAAEGSPEEGAIGTLARISVGIYINVPYPGKYLEATLSVPDGNTDDQIPVELYTINRGEENAVVVSKIDFYTLGELVQTMSFKPVEIAPQSDKYFKNILNTTGFKPGDYLANATVLFDGKRIEVEDGFRIGSLFVNVTNFTTHLQKGGIQKFFIEIESMWNNNIEDIFADVNLTNERENITFRTPPTDLRAWEKKRLEGFLDTIELEGEYDVSILLSYASEHTLTKGTVVIEQSRKNFALIGAIVVSILILAFLVFLYFRKRRLKRK